MTLITVSAVNVFVQGVKLPEPREEAAASETAPEVEPQEEPVEDVAEQE